MKKKILLTIISIVIIAVLVAGLVLYFNVLSNPRKTPEDRISTGYVPTMEELNNSPKYDRVVIMGVDGAGGSFTREGFNLPNFHKIFDEGSINTNGIAQYPTISGPNWASMLTGVTAQKHQMTNATTSIFANSGKNPTIFSSYASANKDAKMISIVAWTQINKGIIENNIPGMTKISIKKQIDTKNATDYDIDRAVVNELDKQLNSQDYKIVFLHFDSVDHAGHKYGRDSVQYKEAMEEIDKDLGIVYESYKTRGLLDTTLFLCVSDHGHTVKGGHGKESDFEKETTLAVSGGLGNVNKGIVTNGKYVTHDLAAIVMYALGVQQPSFYEGGVPTYLFNTLTR